MKYMLTSISRIITLLKTNYLFFIYLSSFLKKYNLIIFEALFLSISEKLTKKITPTGLIFKKMANVG